MAPPFLSSDLKLPLSLGEQGSDLTFPPGQLHLGWRLALLVPQRS